MNFLVGTLLLATASAVSAEKVVAVGSVSGKITPENCGIITAPAVLNLPYFNLTFVEQSTDSSLNIHGNVKLEGACPNTPSNLLFRNPISGTLNYNVNIDKKWLSVSTNPICKDTGIYKICLVVEQYVARAQELAKGAYKDVDGFWVYSVSNKDNLALNIFVGSSVTVGETTITIGSGNVSVTGPINGTIVSLDEAKNATNTKSGALGVAASSLFAMVSLAAFFF
jgi:hypothetical protein